MLRDFEWLLGFLNLDIDTVINTQDSHLKKLIELGLTYCPQNLHWRTVYWRSLPSLNYSINVKMEDLYWLLFSCSGVSVSSKRISYNTNNSLSVPNRRPEHIYPAHAISGSRQLAPAPRLIGSNNPGKKSTGHLATQPATRKYISVVKKYLIQLSWVSRVHKSIATIFIFRYGWKE